MLQNVRDFEQRMRLLERLALPDPEDRVLFEQQMRVADEAGMNYREALEHVIRVRTGGAD